MRGINKAIVAGRVGRDITVRYTTQGDAIANFSLATHYKNAAKEDKTEWHRINCFGKTAEIAGDYLKKGSVVFIEGSLRTRRYFDKNKVERWVTEILAHHMQFLDRKPKNERPVAAHPPEEEQASTVAEENLEEGTME